MGGRKESIGHDSILRPERQKWFDAIQLQYGGGV